MGLANVALNLFGFSILFGMNSAFDKLASEALIQGDVAQCAIIFNKAKILYILTFIPVTLILMQTEDFFKLLGQDDKVAHCARIYAISYLPALFAIGMIDLQRRFLNLFGKT